MSKSTGLCNYNAAVHWLHKPLILCNNITEVDPSVLDNMRKELYDEETEEYIEIYQWFLTGFSDFDIKWMEKTYPDLIFSYSDKLDLWVLCVDHCGTGWNYVMTTCTQPCCERGEGEGI